MILQTSDFVGSFAIGQFQLNESLLQWYIDNHEKDFFITFFSSDYYADLQTRLSSSDTDTKTAAESELAEYKYALIAYVWLYYTSREQEKLTGAGVTIQEETNAETTNMDMQCNRVYNDMIMRLRRCSNTNIQRCMLKFRNCLGI